MYSVVGNTTSLVLGFPIRTSSDQRSVGSSPRHIAASNVLHRLPVPRHPPCALKHLQHKNQKMSFKRNCTSNAHKTRPHPQGVRPHILRARCSQPLSTNQTPHPTTKVRQQHTPRPQRDRTAGLLSQSPIVCLAVPQNSVSHTISKVCCAPSRRHYSDQAPHGYIPTNWECLSWCSLERR